MIRIALMATLIWGSPSYAGEPVVVACKFETLPLMMMVFRGGMGADDNTLQVGQDEPVTLNVGSSMVLALYDGQEYRFSLRVPATVTVDGLGVSAASLTFDGECVSSLRR